MSPRSTLLCPRGQGGLGQVVQLKGRDSFGLCSDFSLGAAALPESQELKTL